MKTYDYHIWVNKHPLTVKFTSYDLGYHAGPRVLTHPHAPSQPSPSPSSPALDPWAPRSAPGPGGTPVTPEATGLVTMAIELGFSRNFLGI